MICPNQSCGSVDVIRTATGGTVSFVASEVVTVQVRKYTPGFNTEERYDIWVYLKGCSEELWMDSSKTIDDANRKKDEFLQAVNTIKNLKELPFVIQNILYVEYD